MNAISALQRQHFSVIASRLRREADGVMIRL
jgi:hypothetical protein